MADRLNVGIKDPVVLAFSNMDEDHTGRRYLALDAIAANGGRVSIAASRERWQGLFRAVMGGAIGQSQAEVARGMFIRDEIDVADFERALTDG